LTQETFIKELERKGYSYEPQGEKCIVTYRGSVWLSSLQSLPPGVVFQNKGNVDLESLQTLPPGVVFQNGGYVNLYSLRTLPPGVEFRNEGDVWLDSLQNLSPGVEFRNKGGVWSGSLIGGWFDEWSGNIKGVHPTDLLNHLIQKGAFI
jgi:hypothetical protein